MESLDKFCKGFTGLVLLVVVLAMIGQTSGHVRITFDAHITSEKDDEISNIIAEDQSNLPIPLHPRRHNS